MERRYNVGDFPLPGYRLVKFLGRGVYGEVWKAVRPDQIEVALKISSLEDQKKGIKEYRALQRVRNYRHPNLVPINGFYFKDRAGKVLDFTSESDSVLLELATELIIDMGLGEKTLLERLQEFQNEGKEGIPKEELLGYMEGSASGIDFLNGLNRTSRADLKSIQHGDIKPQNIMIVGGGVWVCDFGLARFLGSDVRATQADPGSIPYSSPEGLDNKGTETSDQYSLAVTYVELRTGSLPVQSKTPLAMMWEIAKGDLDFSMLPPAERQVIKRATALDPAKRFPNSAEMVRALRNAIMPSTPSKQRAPSGPWRPGLEIVPGYKLETKIGEGGYGQVWRAVRPGGFPVALKIVDHLEANAGKQEFKALKLIKRLYHDNLLELRGYWLLDKDNEIIPDEVQDQPESPTPNTLVIEARLADKNLLQRLKECGEQNGIPPEELLSYMRQAADAIDFMNEPQHEFEGQTISIQHRDIKPENILLVGKKVQVADFGLVRILEGEQGRVHAGSRGFTPHYAAAELFIDQVTRWTDQYSLALTYYRLRTGKELFERTMGWGEIMLRHTQGQLDLGALAKSERAVISQASSPEPTRRFGTCMEMVEALEWALHPTGAGQRPPIKKEKGPVVPTPRPIVDKKPETLTPHSKKFQPTPQIPGKTNLPITTPQLEPISDGPTTGWEEAKVLVESPEGQPKETQGPGVEKVNTPTLVPKEEAEPEWKRRVKGEKRIKPKTSGIDPKTREEDRKSQGKNTPVSSKKLLLMVVAALFLIGAIYFAIFRNDGKIRDPEIADIKSLIEQKKFPEARRAIDGLTMTEEKTRELNIIRQNWRKQIKDELKKESLNKEQLITALNVSRDFLVVFPNEIEAIVVVQEKALESFIENWINNGEYRRAFEILRDPNLRISERIRKNLEGKIRNTALARARQEFDSGNYTSARDICKDLLEIINDTELEKLKSDSEEKIVSLEFDEGKKLFGEKKFKEAEKKFKQAMSMIGSGAKLKRDANFHHARVNAQLAKTDKDKWPEVREELKNIPKEELGKDEKALYSILFFLASPHELPSNFEDNQFFEKMTSLIKGILDVKPKDDSVKQEPEWKDLGVLGKELINEFVLPKFKKIIEGLSNAAKLDQLDECFDLANSAKKFIEDFEDKEKVSKNLDKQKEQAIRELIDFANRLRYSGGVKKGFDSQNPLQDPFSGKDSLNVYKWLKKAKDLSDKEKKPLSLEATKDLAFVAGQFDNDPSLAQELLKNYQFNGKKEELIYYLVKAKMEPSRPDGDKAAFPIYKAVYEILNRDNLGQIRRDRYDKTLWEAIKRGEKASQYYPEIKKELSQCYLGKAKLIETNPIIWEWNDDHLEILNCYDKAFTHDKIRENFVRVCQKCLAYTDEIPKEKKKNYLEKGLKYFADLNPEWDQQDLCYQVQGRILEEIAYEFMESERWPKAIEAYSQAIKINKSKGIYYLDRGRCYHKQAIGSNPSSMVRASLLMQARQDLEKSLGQEFTVRFGMDDRFEANFWLGMTFCEQDPPLFGSAVEYLMLVLAVKPCRKEHKKMFEKSLEVLHKKIGEDLFKKSIEQNKKDLEWKFINTDDLEILKRAFITARQKYREVDSSEKEYESSNRIRLIGEAYRNSKRYSEALEIFDKGLPEKLDDVGYPNALLLVVRNALYGGYFEKLRVNQPNLNIQKILPHADKAIELVDKSPYKLTSYQKNHRKAEARIAAALCYKVANNLEKAKQLLEEAKRIPELGQEDIKAIERLLTELPKT